MATLPPAAYLVLSAIVSYLIGGLPFGYWFVRFTAGKDIRTLGSGNIGATNVHRTQGRKAGVIVLLLDILKGFLAVLFAAWLSRSDPTALGLAAAFVMLGHCFPAFLSFKGGKAVACYIGAFLYIAPWPLLVVGVLFVAIVALWRYISMGSILGALLFPVFYWIMNRPPAVLIWVSVFCGLLIVVRHKQNIDRLINGKENAFSFRGGKA
jgi:acyl phosphate:glycerol-3-phosphate acyltransferase